MNIQNLGSIATLANRVGVATESVNASQTPASSQIRGDAMNPAQRATTAEPTTIEVKQAAQSVQEIVQTMASNLEFSVDQDSGRTVVKLTDSQTGEMIRQIPSKEMLELARQIEQFQGLLLKDKA